MKKKEKTKLLTFRLAARIKRGFPFISKRKKKKSSHLYREEKRLGKLFQANTFITKSLRNIDERQIHILLKTWMDG
jgi:hypothetical protein